MEVQIRVYMEVLTREVSSMEDVTREVSSI